MEAVLAYTQAKKVVVIGHSMGGGIIAEASRLMPKKIITCMQLTEQKEIYSV